jgi:uncharacterized protein
MSNRSLQGRWVFDARRTAVPPSDAHPVGLLSRYLAMSLIRLIDAYKRLVSPLLGPHCRFHPTCSRYAMEAIRIYGPMRGSVRALARLARCHPLSLGGYDPVR